MKARLLCCALAALAASLAAPASAQRMKPGLWEISNKMQSGDGQMEKAMEQMQKQMASMPPEQRKMMEEMMAKRGMHVSSDGTGMVVKVCMTKEMVAQNEVPMHQQGNCTSTKSNMSSAGMHVSFSCTNPPSSGEGDIVFSGDTGYTMKMKMNSTVHGKAQTMSMDATAHWLDANCGDVKPPQMPKAK